MTKNKTSEYGTNIPLFVTLKIGGFEYNNFFYEKTNIYQSTLCSLSGFQHDGNLRRIGTSGKKVILGYHEVDVVMAKRVKY